MNELNRVVQYLCYRDYLLNNDRTEYNLIFKYYDKVSDRLKIRYKELTEVASRNLGNHFAQITDFRARFWDDFTISKGV